MPKIKSVGKVILLVLLSLTLLSTSVYANQPGFNQSEDKAEYFRGLVSKESDAKVRSSIENTIKLHKEMDQQVLKSLQSKTNSNKKPSQTNIAPLATTDTSVLLGSPFTLGYATEGASGGENVIGISSYNSTFATSSNESLVKCSSWAYGDATAWAWNGRRFDVLAGTQISQTAYFQVNGNYAASCTATGPSYASYALDFKLYDATTQQWVATNGITVGGAGGGSEGAQSQKTLLGPYSKNIFSATLQAGHEYVALLQAESTATNILGTAQANGYDLPTYYADWDTINVSY